jgi:hypothetical protein
MTKEEVRLFEESLRKPFWWSIKIIWFNWDLILWVPLLWYGQAKTLYPNFLPIVHELNSHFGSKTSAFSENRRGKPGSAIQISWARKAVSHSVLSWSPDVTSPALRYMLWGWRCKNWCLKRYCVSRLGSTAPFLTELANGSFLAFGGKIYNSRKYLRFIRFVSAKRKE